MSTITSVQSGDFEDISTWDLATIPSVGDKVVIANTHTVILNSNLDTGDGSNAAIDIESGGILDFSKTIDITIQVTGRIHVRQGGKLGNSSSINRHNNQLIFQLNKSNGSGLNYGLHVQGSFSFYGIQKTTNTSTTSASLSGTNIINVSNASNWQVGDSLVIRRQDSFSNGDSDFHRTTISAISGTSVTLNDNLPWDIGIETPVGNRSKNIRFERHSNATGKGTSFYFRNIIGDIEGDNFLVKNTDSNNNLAQGMFAFGQTTNSEECTVDLSDICLISDDTTIRGFELGDGFRLPNANFSNFLIDLEDSSQSILYVRSGSTCVLDNFVFYQGGVLQSAWGQGSSALLIKRSKFLSNKSSANVSISAAISLFFEDCEFLGGSSTGRYFDITDLGLMRFTRCKFGSTDQGWNIVKSRIFNSNGGNTNQTCELIDCTDTCTSTNLVDITGGNTTYEAVSDTSYLYLVRQNSNEYEIYKSAGKISKSNEYTVIGDNILKFSRNNNVKELKQTFSFDIDSGVNARISAFYRRNKSYQDTTDIHTSLVSSTGTVSTSGSYNGDSEFSAFNRGSGRFISSNSNGDVWIQYQFNTPKIISAYRMTATNPDWLNRTPKNWTLQASNTGTFLGEEVILDTQTKTDWEGYQTYLFEFENTTSYTYYRLVITESQSEPEFTEIDELFLLEEQTIELPQLRVNSNSVSEFSTFANTTNTWLSLTINAQQSTGSLENFNIDFVTRGGKTDNLAYLGFLAISSYGKKTILIDSPSLSAEKVFVSDRLEDIPEITLSEFESQNITGVTVQEHSAPVSFNGKNFSITVTGDTSINPTLTLNDIKHYLYYNLNRIESFSGRATGYHWHDLLPFSSNESKAGNRDKTGVKGVRVIDQNGAVFEGISRLQADDQTYLDNERVTVTVTTPSGFNDEIFVYSSLSDAEDKINSLASGETFSYQASSLGGSTIYWRMEASDNTFIIDSYILPSETGNYDVTLVTTSTEIALTSIKSVTDKLETMISTENGYNRFNQESLIKSNLPNINF